ncbi:MAG: 1-acyl-sn-glycerol-3-phosphate acyltransferase [Candidatus Zixiibacteriota bacterium]|nr:MAG: 1-acyl-sn-glycerol-3-phosphate acyltransferase [candidate division Zixibacteria bacterium]
MTWFYWICWRLVRSIAQILFRIKVFNLENIPDEGAFILASNHISLSDPPLVSTAIRRPVHFMAKKELFSIPVLGSIIRNLNAHPIHRGFDRRAIEEAVGILSRGGGLLIFPEGTRGLHGQFLPARPGIGMVAIKTGALVVPAYIHGANHKKACFLGREKLAIIFGKPIGSSELGEYEDNKAGYRRLSEAIMDRISDLKKDLQKRLHIA